MQFETNFGVVALQFLEEDRQRENAPPAAAITPSGWIVVGSGPSSNTEGVSNAIPERKSSKGLRASLSTSHISSFATNPPVVSGEYVNIHCTVCVYENVHMWKCYSIYPFWPSSVISITVHHLWHDYRLFHLWLIIIISYIQQIPWWMWSNTIQIKKSNSGPPPCLSSDREELHVKTCISYMSYKLHVKTFFLCVWMQKITSAAPGNDHVTN